jgi:polyisoprenoid-binding protein YceI
MIVSLNGTSNLHDWEMKAAKGKSEVSFAIGAGNKIESITKLSFTLPVKNLKSDHTGMDNNTYKALKSPDHPNFSFEMTSGVITSTGINSYLINCKGKLSIAGKTNDTEILATGVYDPSDKSITISGVKKMKMTDFNVAPPKALMGTIKTGNDISVSYTIKFIR